MTPGLQVLFAPYLERLGAVRRNDPPELVELAAMAAAAPVAPRTARGMPVQFMAAGSVPAADYETTISRSGAVPTRPLNWHDAFNALVWCTFPATKAALNAGHDAQIAAGEARARGRVRDALTLFDECGVLVLSSDAEWLDLLRGHAWREALFDTRARDEGRREIIVFGHASLDALRHPFPGLCAKALYRQVSPAWFEHTAGARWREADAWMARWLTARGGAFHPRDLAPLPLLGWPGVVPENAAGAYYQDVSQFRPRRQAGLAGLRCV